MYVAGGEGSIRGALYMSLFRYPRLPDSETELSVEESSSSWRSGSGVLVEPIFPGILSIHFERSLFQISTIDAPVSFFRNGV